MKLFVITGASGAGKSTVSDILKSRPDAAEYACIGADEIGINWWDYAGTDREGEYNFDCMREALRRADGRDLIFASCLNPADYAKRADLPDEIEAAYFIALCPDDGIIAERLRARPPERRFTTEEAIIPHTEYNRWIREHKDMYGLFIDSGEITPEETAERTLAFIQSTK